MDPGQQQQQPLAHVVARGPQAGMQQQPQLTPSISQQRGLQTGLQPGQLPEQHQHASAMPHAYSPSMNPYHAAASSGMGSMYDQPYHMPYQLHGTSPRAVGLLAGHNQTVLPAGHNQSVPVSNTLSLPNTQQHITGMQPQQVNTAQLAGLQVRVKAGSPLPGQLQSGAAATYQGMQSLGALGHQPARPGNNTPQQQQQQPQQQQQQQQQRTLSSGTKFPSQQPGIPTQIMQNQQWAAKQTGLPYRQAGGQLAGPNHLALQQQLPSPNFAVGNSPLPQGHAQGHLQSQLQSQQPVTLPHSDSQLPSQPPNSQLDSQSHSQSQAQSPQVLMGQTQGLQRSQPSSSVKPAGHPGTAGDGQTHGQEGQRYLGKRNLLRLLGEVDPQAVVDPDAEEALLMIAENFSQAVLEFGVELGQHRHSDTFDVCDIILPLERVYHIKVPGFNSDDYRSYKKPRKT